MPAPEFNDPSLWELEHRFERLQGDPVTCGDEQCTFGIYALKPEKLTGGIMLTFSPACTTCEFAAPLPDIFNDAEPRFTPGASEGFKRCAAQVLLATGALDTISMTITRPDTAEMILAYGAGEVSSD